MCKKYKVIKYCTDYVKMRKSMKYSLYIEGNNMRDALKRMRCTSPIFIDFDNVNSELIFFDLHEPDHLYFITSVQ